MAHRTHDLHPRAELGHALSCRFGVCYLRPSDRALGPIRCPSPDGKQHDNSPIKGCSGLFGLRGGLTSRTSPIALQARPNGTDGGGSIGDRPRLSALPPECVSTRGSLDRNSQWIQGAWGTTGILREIPPNLSNVKDADGSKKPINANHRNRLARSRELTRDKSIGMSGKQWSSQVLHRIGEASEHAAAGLIAAVALLTWIMVGIATGFPAWWENVLYIASSSVTVVMVFALQHTQARQQAVTQRKLDELLRAQPTADDRLIALEGASDEELAALTDLSRAYRERALETDTPPSIADPLK
jgi:low affinity Fe/Cu permease